MFHHIIWTFIEKFFYFQMKNSIYRKWKSKLNLNNRSEILKILKYKIKSQIKIEKPE